MGGPVVFGFFLAYRVFFGGDDGSSFDLRPGVCVNSDDLSIDSTGEILLDEVSCEQPHDGEIYHVVRNDDWATDASDVARFKALDEACVQHFAGYVGVNAAAGSFGGAFFGSSTDDGDVACLLMDEQGGQLTGSRRDWRDTPPDGTDTALSSLAAGDCFMGLEEGVGAFAVEGRDCAEPHNSEVFAVLRLPGATYPTGDVEADANEQCLPTFESYVGLPYEESALGLMGIPPTPSTWAFGDRQVICVLGSIDGEPLMGSTRGAGV